VIEGDAHQEHGDAPAQGAEHSLVTVLIRILAQQSYHSRIRQSDRRCAEELPNEDHQQQQEECLLDVLWGKKKIIIILFFNILKIKSLWQFSKVLKTYLTGTS